MDKNFRFFKGQSEAKEQKLQLKDFLYEKNIEKILDVAVSGVDAYKSLSKEDTTMQKVVKFVPTLIVLAGAIEAFGKSGPEFKDLDSKEIEDLRTKYLPKFGVDGKIGVYAIEGINILLSAFKIYKAK